MVSDIAFECIKYKILYCISEMYCSCNYFYFYFNYLDMQSILNIWEQLQIYFDRNL